MWYSTWSIIICREVAEEKIAKTKKNSLPKYHILFLNFSLFDQVDWHQIY